MTRGPKPKPAGVRSQIDTVRSKRTRKPAAAVAVEVVTVGGVRPPAWLKGEALIEWNARAGALVAAKLLSVADITPFARYCRNLALWLKLRDEIDKAGVRYETETPHGRMRRLDPGFMAADRLERQLLAIEDRFAMNPAERQRIIAARINSGTGDLFGGVEAKREGDPASKATEAAKPIESPIGMLQ
jgi:P27 family predicted phage terminase small subunit